MIKNSVCVIGSGYWGKNHVRTLDELGCLAGVVDENPTILKEISNSYPHIKSYSNLNQALEDSSILGFIVATPATTHYDITCKIIKSGKHVLVEKPFCLNIKDAESLINLSNKYDTNLMVGHVLLFHPAIQAIKKLIDSKKIGKLQYIYSNRLNLGQIRTEENVFWSLAPHDISIFQFITNSSPYYIHCQGSSFLQKGIHDSTITQLKYDNGVEGHIFVSWLHPFKEHRLTIIGSEAMLTFEDSAENKPLKLYSKKFDMSSGIPKKYDGPIEVIDYEKRMPLTEELKYFCNHLKNKKPKIANGLHALENTKILVAASQQL